MALLSAFPNILLPDWPSKQDCLFFSCVAPMRWSGSYITNVTLEFCPTFDTTFAAKKGFTLGDLKPRHVLWSIFGVAMVVLAGMLLGLLVNTTKAFYIRNFKSQPIRYFNINSDSSFA